MLVRTPSSDMQGKSKREGTTGKHMSMSSLLYATYMSSLEARVTPI